MKILRGGRTISLPNARLNCCHSQEYGSIYDPHFKTRRRMRSRPPSLSAPSFLASGSSPVASSPTTCTSLPRSTPTSPCLDASIFAVARSPSLAPSELMQVEDDEAQPLQPRVGEQCHSATAGCQPRRESAAATKQMRLNVRWRARPLSCLQISPLVSRLHKTFVFVPRAATSPLLASCCSFVLSVICSRVPALLILTLDSTSYSCRQVFNIHA